MNKGQTLLIKSEKLENGLYGMPLNCVKMDRIPDRRNEVLHSAILIGIAETYPKQNDMLKTFEANKRVICCSSRQIGKCIVFWTWIKIRHKKYNWLKFNIPIGLAFKLAKSLKNK